MLVRIEPLGNQDRSAFSSGELQLDDWFRKRAGQDQKRNIARVFVALDDTLGVIGFYSLSTYSLALTDLPQDIARKLPRYDAIPAALIGRLARDERVRGRGVGELLLADAVRRILAAGRSVAVFVIVVGATERAVEFYKTFGFAPFPQRPQRLFLLSSVAIAALRRMWGAAQKPGSGENIAAPAPQKSWLRISRSPNHATKKTTVRR